jgi:DNA mismatch repair protein MutS
MVTKNSSPYTPMMMQYLRIKAQHPDALIFFRLGDFYELFFDDAKIASKELSLVLTGKSAGQPERVPMCGIPHHAYKSYVKKLVQKGFKVGIVEQLEDARLAKGIVERDVTQIYTPGSFVDSDETDHHFLAAIATDQLRYLIVYGDVTTGDIYVDYVPYQWENLFAFLKKLSVHEVVVSPELASQFEPLLAKEGIYVSSFIGPLISTQEPMEPLILDAYHRLLSYLHATQKRPLTFFKPLVHIPNETVMKLDAFSLANLEILENVRHRDVQGSLFWLLDETVTAMGTRLLKQWLLSPSAHEPTIRLRHDMVGALIKNFLILSSLQSELDQITDLPRLISKCHFGQANARDLIALKNGLQVIPAMQSLLAQIPGALAQTLTRALTDFSPLVNLLDRALVSEPPLSIKEGGMFRLGYNAQLDHWLQLSKGGKTALLTLETKERQRTGIKNLKVGYNQVFGYFIEVSNGQLSAIQPDFGYERRQTLANGERFITKELKALESELFQAEEKRCLLEETLFHQLVDNVLASTLPLQQVADAIAQIDVLAAFALVSSQYQFVAPSFHEQRRFLVEQSRHPVIEKVMKKSTFVANDFLMDEATNTLLITGPNMGGKSTYMRQIALLIILAQIGCYVPAKRAELMIVDAIFTRIGASDDLVGGQSTFMMEMTQTQYALANATSRSLLIFDEIGRGTATFDGMALAHAIMEYATLHIQAKTLFSTHYHELTTLAETMTALKNIHVAVYEQDDQVTFLYQVKPGAMSRSFGIHVATLAALPPTLIERAKTMLTQLEQTPRSVAPPQAIPPLSPVETQLRNLNPLTLSPLDALKVLIDLKNKVGS